MGDEGGGLQARALIAADGGEWSGLLFDNSVVGLEPALTWTLRIPFAPVGGDPVLLEIEWLPDTAAGWQRLAGLHVSSGSFAEPAEAVIHHHGHHRYDRVDVQVTAQDGPLITASVALAGDVDALGPGEITCTAALRFTGIDVQLQGVSNATEALQRLAGHTDTTGLIEIDDPRGIAFRFGPG
ncbi:hypothetical protein [Paractinoplanes atraurantiacus]|uniref:Uncharacterized protein n=1 Tax=Paractinoplanes atraurantiacus TaxID=1036182 RepID=A0A285IDR9_9ACTN|nr:hypothetical protein [Actinoplanes atraurantiacus]SNY45216.1 hypothetical protein SAMN05421748_107190 [Actinoplanes atraurantiacus]